MKEPQTQNSRNAQTGKVPDSASQSDGEYAEIRKKLREPGGEAKVAGSGFSPGRKKAIAKTDDALLGSSREVHKLESSPGKYSPRGRKLRKAFERPRPDLPSDAPENRSRKIVSMTLPRDLLEMVDQRARDLDVDRTAYIETALRASLKPSP